MFKLAQFKVDYNNTSVDVVRVENFTGTYEAVRDEATRLNSFTVNNSKAVTTFWGLIQTPRVAPIRLARTA